MTTRKRTENGSQAQRNPAPNDPKREENEKLKRDRKTREYGGEHPNDFERQKDKGYGQEPFDEQQFENDTGSGSFNEGGARGNSGH